MEHFHGEQRDQKSNLYDILLKVFHFICHAHIFHNHELLNTDTKNDVLILLCLKMVQNRWKYVSSMYEYGPGVRIPIGLLHWPLTVAESCRLEIQCSISRTKRPRSNLAGAFSKGAWVLRFPQSRMLWDDPNIKINRYRQNHPQVLKICSILFFDLPF